MECYKCRVKRVLTFPGVAHDHLVAGLEGGGGDLADGVALVARLGLGDHRGVAHQGEVDAGEGHQVGLELVQVNIEGAEYKVMFVC